MITYHDELTQGSDEWLAARCGMLTASEMHLILTPTLKIANNDKTRAHVYELAAQRITGYVEPHYISDDMLRGMNDENTAREIYGAKFDAVQTTGFVVNDGYGFKLGYSPDGLIGDTGLIEIKSRRQKFQIQTAVEGVPDEYALQLQTALLVTGRAWVDYISYSGGMPMTVQRVTPNATMMDAILAAATEFEAKIAAVMQQYNEQLAKLRSVPTERVVEQEITL